MESRVFVFLGMISHDRMFIVLSHVAIVVLTIFVLSKIATRNLKVIPTGTQNIFELYIESLLALSTDVLGSNSYARKYLPLIATIGLFVFFANLLGIFPGFESPTAFLDYTISLAVVVFIYYNYEGIRKNGVFKYFAHFLGPVWWLYWLIFPIEIVSHFSRLISLSFRLFGNIKGDDLFLIVMLMLAPYVVPPLVSYGLLSVMAFLQSFVFVILTLVYLSGAISTEEH